MLAKRLATLFSILAANYIAAQMLAIRFIVHPEIFFLARLFVDVPDTKIWLTNPAPGRFSAMGGPIVLPDDPIIRVDLLSGETSGPAKPAES